MNDPESEPIGPTDSMDSPNAFLPLVLISIAFISILLWQIVNISGQKKMVMAAKEQLETNFATSTPQQEKLIEQSKAVQAKLEAFATDLINLAKDGDADAKKIVEKYKIQQQQPAATPAPVP